FRKTFVPPQGKTPAFLTLAYAVDNVYTFFINGQEIATESVWYTAGSIFDGIVTYTDDSTSPIVSDTTWRTSTSGLPSGFQDLTFDDSTWSPAVTEGGNGGAPWETLLWLAVILCRLLWLELFLRDKLLVP
ncbi:hypothetical protein FB446DRAFT_810715, partial [Lentinula raphanica]